MLSNRKIAEFLEQSNRIEGVFDDGALADAFNAWEYIMTKDALKLSDILKVHKKLMCNLNPRIAGKLRTCDVWIGGSKRSFISEELLKKSLNAVIKMINSDIGEIKSKVKKKERIKDHHVMFEGIHPFEDGNGRTGRIIYNWQLVKNGLPLHIIHCGEEQYNYYDWFREYDKTNTETEEVQRQETKKGSKKIQKKGSIRKDKVSKRK